MAPFSSSAFIPTPEHERRRHRAIVTDNTEYHLHDEMCVGVRERRGRTWMADHPAIGGRLQRSTVDWEAAPRMVGLSAVFTLGRGAVIATSPVRDIVRPEREAPQNYLRHACNDGSCTRPSRPRPDRLI